MLMLFVSLILKGDIEASVMPVVCEFPYVFPKDIYDLPPEHKVDYTIDLIPDTRFVSMAPYKIFASELGELKKQ